MLPPNDEGVQVACGQHFSMCLTTAGKIVIWGSLNGKTNSDDGFFYEKPVYGFERCSISPDFDRTDFHSFSRHLKGFSDRRMIQIAAGYTHCLGLTDVS